MRYTIFVQHRPDGRYEASVPVMPGIAAEGETREGTIVALKQAMRAALATGEFVSIELPDHAGEEPNP